MKGVLSIVIVILGKTLMLLQSELIVIPTKRAVIYLVGPVTKDVPVSRTAIKLLGEVLQFAGGTYE